MTMTHAYKQILACLYARYSSDKQRETSIEDQLRNARLRAQEEEWQIVATHADEGVSGSTPVRLRRGGRALMAAAETGQFQVLIVEGLDRICREVGEQERIVKSLEHLGVRIIGTSDGYDSRASGRKVMRIARGMVNELYLDDLREKTHRGLAGQFDRGLSAGGRSYGYRSEECTGGRRLVIDAVQATIVREIFEAWAAGSSARAIVRSLNNRGVPSPRGKQWAVSAVQGSASRGLGILHNSLYRGCVLWNRKQWSKDPESGRRRSVDRPSCEWQVRQEPELRIISEELWDAAQGRMTRVDGTRKGRGRSPRTLFGGLIRCPKCHGPFIAVNSSRYGCNNYRDRGETACTNNATVARDVVDRRLLAEVRGELETPTAMRELRTVVKEELAERQRASRAGLASASERLDEVNADIMRLVDAIAKVGVSEALATRLKKAEEESRRLMVQVAQEAGPSAAEIASEIEARYRRALTQLQEVLQSGDVDRTRPVLAEMLGPVTIVRDDEGTWAQMAKPADRLLLQAMGGSLKVVAGAGFEPTTFGL